jgi:hypothetical protein
MGISKSTLYSYLAELRSMPATRHSPISADSLLALRQRLDRLSPKSPERATQVKSIAELYGVSTDTVYRSLRDLHKPKAVQRGDPGQPRVLPKARVRAPLRAGRSIEVAYD